MNERERDLVERALKEISTAGGSRTLARDFLHGALLSDEEAEAALAQNAKDDHRNQGH